MDAEAKEKLPLLGKEGAAQLRQAVTAVISEQLQGEHVSKLRKNEKEERIGWIHTAD